jgi:hypothetical protein
MYFEKYKWKKLVISIICSNFAADLVRSGSEKLWHEVKRLAEKPQYTTILIKKCTQL